MDEGRFIICSLFFFTLFPIIPINFDHRFGLSTWVFSCHRVVFVEPEVTIFGPDSDLLCYKLCLKSLVGKLYSQYP